MLAKLVFFGIYTTKVLLYVVFVVKTIYVIFNDYFRNMTGTKEAVRYLMFRQFDVLLCQLFLYWKLPIVNLSTHFLVNSFLLLNFL
jgi:hypothetical protein